MNTTFNALAVLTAAGVIALAGSPVVAKTHVRPQPAPAIMDVPADAHMSAVSPYGPAQHVYAPSLPAGPYAVHGLSPDFQLSHQ